MHRKYFTSLFRHNKMKKGMTLVELLVAMALIIIVVGIIYSLYSYTFTQTMFFERYWPGQSSAQFSMFMITKYLNNAATASATTTYSASGNYIILSKNTLYRRIVSTNVSTNVIAKNIHSVFFTTSSKTQLVTIEIAGDGFRNNISGATLTTNVFLNNNNMSKTKSSSGTILFYK